MPIKTSRLVLRPPQIGDENALNEAILESYEVLNKSMLWADHKPTAEESEMQARLAAANWILKKNDEPYLPVFMFDKLTDQFIGATGYHHYNWEVPCLEIGYWIRISCAGQGFMTEAVNALTQYAFKQLGVKRIAITCDVDNIPSKRIPEKLHYCLESIVKSNRLNSKGDITDTLVYAKYDLLNLPNLDVNW
ncbi:MAG: GNAT family N-acetyltransferase [Gammaproteobacteria bacterium]|nr:GNAT family N-acetyltransferase [Gammaproteobacteria bacterium]